MSDLFADVRDILEALKRREGQAAFVMLALTIVTSAALFMVALGFDRLSDVSLVNPRFRPFQCRTPDNIQSMFIVIGGVVFTLLAVLTMGEAMLFFDRKRRGQPGNARAMLGPAAAMLAVALVGVVGMRIWC